MNPLTSNVQKHGLSEATCNFYLGRNDGLCKETPSLMYKSSFFYACDYCINQLTTLAMIPTRYSGPKRMKDTSPFLLMFDMNTSKKV